MSFQSPLARCPLTLALALAALATCATAQTGSITPTQAELDSLPRFTASAIQLVEEQTVDLRPWMPPVGLQRMNDCTAWAMAYGAKTYAEAREQGWKPDAPDRIFSPRFLYNQINQGNDQGSNFMRAILLMKKEGAATLATEPYRPGDFKGKPTARARKEAPFFRVSDGFVLTNTKSIRRALQRRTPVVFGAKVFPVFFSGRFDIYTRSIFERDRQNVRPGQPHGNHAMIIVGYDDRKKAFLVQNSWGMTWGKRGYAFVSYDLFETIAVTTSGPAKFCRWAVFLEDVEEPVRRGRDGLPVIQPLDLRTIKIRGFADIHRYDKKQDKYLYTFQARLNGQGKALDEIASVTWSWTDQKGKPQTFTSKDRKDRFFIIAGTIQSPVSVEATATLKNGEALKVKGSLPGQNPKADFRKADIWFDDEYSRMLSGRVPQYYWEAGLDVPLNHVDDIVEVVWEVGKLNPREPRQRLYGFNGKPAEEKAIGITTRTDTLRATIRYADGGLKTVTKAVRLDDTISEDFVIEVDVKEAGLATNGDPSYAFSLTMDRPARFDGQLDKVIWELDPSFGGESFESPRFYDDFLLTGQASRDFRVRATTLFNDGTSRKSEKWVRLGPNSGYENDLRIGLDSYDFYASHRGGRPVWNAVFRIVGDVEGVTEIASVNYETLIDGKPRFPRQVLPSKDGTFAISEPTSGPVTMRATVKTRAGRELVFERTHTPRSPANGALGIARTIEGERSIHYAARGKDERMAHFSLVGPNDSRHDVLRVDWVHEGRGRVEINYVNPRRLGASFLTEASALVTQPFDLRAIVHSKGGWVEMLEAPVSLESSGETVSDLRVRAREKFWGWKDGVARWLAEGSLVGDEARVSQVEKVAWTVDFLPTGRRTASPPTPRDPRAAYETLLTQPALLVAIVTFKDGTKQELTGRTLCMARRSKEPVEIRYAEQRSSRGDGIMWEAWLAGHEEDLRRIKSVKWDLPGDRLDHFREIADNQRMPLWSIGRFTKERTLVRAEVTFRDGTSTKLAKWVGDIRRELSYAYGESYWGDGIFEISLMLSGDIEEQRRVFRGIDWVNPQGRKIGVRAIPSFPRQPSRGLFKPGKLSLKEVQFTRESNRVEKMTGGTITVGQARRIENLAIVNKASSWQDPGAAEGSAREWAIGVEGPEKDLSRIRQVSYTVRSDDGSWTRLSDLRNSAPPHAFGVRQTAKAAPTVTATVTFVDGSTRTLEP